MSEIGKLGVLIFWSFIQIFIFCDTSERVTSHFREVDMYYLCDWYAFPAVVRRMMPIIIVNTNKRVVISGYGNVSCTRETFNRVSKEWNWTFSQNIWNYFVFIFLSFFHSLLNRWPMVDFLTLLCFVSFYSELSWNIRESIHKNTFSLAIYFLFITITVDKCKNDLNK